MDALTNSSAYAKRRRRSLVLSVIGALILFFLLILPRIYGHFRSGASLTAESQLTSRVEQKKFSQVLRLSGTTQATRSFIVSAPQLEGAQLNNLNITALIPAGSAVKQDEILVQFDPQAQVKDFLDKQKTYTDLVSQVEQKKAEGEITKAKDDTALAQSENALKKAQLEVQRNEIVSRIDAEKNQEALEEAQVTLSQIKKTYDLKRTAATAAVRILEIQRDRAQEAMRYAQSNSDKMTIRAPMNGVAVLNTIWLGSRMGTVQKGDSVQPGVPFMQVVDPSQMEVRAMVSQSDLDRVHAGQAATVHFDAYPGMRLPAVLTEVSPLGEQGKFSEKIRTFSALFSIQGNDPRLLPDLSAALDIVLQSSDSALVVPRNAIGHESSGDFVWVKGATGYDKRAVKLGPLSDTEAVILSGVSGGDMVRSIPSESTGRAPTP
jgi:RND family efflux transporter MFP subunit